jgi:hypothetical protein
MARDKVVEVLVEKFIRPFRFRGDLLGRVGLAGRGDQGCGCRQRQRRGECDQDFVFHKVELKCVVILGWKIYGAGVGLGFASFGIGVGLAFLRAAANSGRSFASSVESAT